MSPVKKETRLALVARSGGTGKHDPLHFEYVGIIQEIRALQVAVVELSLEPTSVAKGIRVKVLARELKRRCNRLTYKLFRRAAKS